MEKAYKGLMGGYSVLKDSDEKHSATHVVLTMEEYDGLLYNIRSLESKLSNEVTNHKDDVSEINRQAATYKQRVDEEIQNVRAAAEERVRIAEEERDRQSNLNKNLLRITRERANAKRGLQPKKEHHGYRFSGKIMQTKTICGHDKKEGALYTDVWTAILETPYDGTIPIHQIEDKIFGDLMGEGGILKKLYINSFTWKDNPSRIWKGTYTEAIDGVDANKNYLFDYKFMVNPKSRLWEIQITTTKSIRPLDEMMGPRRRKKEQEEVKKKEIVVDDFPLFDRLAPDL